jgi:uncharacterized protein (TIGR02118 family)
MIKVSVMYPNKPGTHFNISYYCTKHMPMVRELVGPALLNIGVDEGIGGMTPDLPVPYLAMGNLYFESVDAFVAAFTPHLAKIVADVKNYTDSEPIVQISTIKI